MNHGRGESRGHKGPKLEIKKDKKGTVMVKGAEIVEVKSGKECLHYFKKANDTRHVASTKMNAGALDDTAAAHLCDFPTQRGAP